MPKLRDWAHAICVVVGIIGIAVGSVLFNSAHGRTHRWIEAIVLLAIGAAFLGAACLLKSPADTIRRIRAWSRRIDGKGDSKGDSKRSG